MRIIRYTCCGMSGGSYIRCQVEFKRTAHTHGNKNRNWQLQGG